MIEGIGTINVPNIQVNKPLDGRLDDNESSVSEYEESNVIATE